MADLFKPLHDLFFAVSEMENSIALRESQFVWPMFEVVHVVFMCIFAGLVIMMDLRLLGVGNMQTPFSQLQKRLFPWQMFGMAGAAATGLVLVFGDPIGAVAWLAGQPRLAGRGLKRGEIVMTGTCTGLTPITLGDRATADFGELGQVRAVFI